MPDVRMPDGTIIRNVPDGTTREQLQQRYKMQQLRSQAAKHPILGPINTFVGNVADSMTLGADDEIQATLDTLNPFSGRPNAFNSGFGKAWKQNQRFYQDRKDELRQANPISAVSGSVAGAVAPLIATGGATQAPRAAANAPRLARVARAVAPAAAQGAVYGFNSGKGGIGERAASAGTGAALGVVADRAGAGLGRAAARIVGGRKAVPAIAPRLSGRGAARQQAVQTLADKGVLLTPGQRSGGIGQRVEDALDTIGLPRRAKESAMDDLNRAIYNEVLTPHRITVKPDVTPGRDAFAEVVKVVNSRYDDAASGLALHVDDDVLGTVNGLAQGAEARMGPQQAQQLQANINNIVSWRARPTPLQGKEVTSALRDIRGAASEARKRGDQGLGDSLWSIHDTLEDAAVRASSPEAVRTFTNARESMRRLRIAENAAEKSTDGIVLPSQLKTAAHAKGYGVNSGTLARGVAPMQDLADSAATVMRDSIGNTGTAERGWILDTLGLGGGSAIALGALSPKAALAGIPAIPYVMPGANRLLQYGRKLPPSRVNRGLDIAGAAPRIGQAGSLAALANAYPFLFSDSEE